MRRRTLLAAPTLALAQDGPVSIIAPFTPGTGPDILARLAAPVLQAALGQAIVVENRPGASGAIGSQAVARAAPDGRTLLMQVNTFVMAPPMFARATYDPVAQFTPIIHLTNGDLVLVVNPALPVTTLAEFVALARVRSLDYGSPGIGTPQHLAMELLRQVAAIPEMNHVPYRGSAPAIQDLLGHRLAAMVLPIHTALPLEGRVRLLAVGSPARVAAAPALPTFAQAGLAGAEVDLWYGLLGPAGMATELVERLRAPLAAWLARPEATASLAAQGMVATGGGPQPFARLIAADQARWTAVIRTARISAE